ncbi:MAG: CARDB domain-containing protein [Thermoplasmatota archaeon]
MEGLSMNSRGVFSIILLIMLGGINVWSGASGSTAPLVPDPDFDPSLGVDVPTWRTGDYWNYSTSFSVTYLGFGIPVTGWMNMSTAFITLDFSYSDSPVYITDIRGNLTGRLRVPPLGIDETIYVNLTGYVWERMQDLSMYRMIINASVSGTLTSLNGNYPFGYEYTPPMEQYDFPLIPGERWEVNVSARAPFGASGDLLNIRQNMTCGDPIERTVPAGTFISYPVSDDSGPILYYNHTVGSTVERIFDMNIQGVQLTIPWELEKYQREPEETRIRIQVDSEEPVTTVTTFYVSGVLTQGNTQVTLFFPGGKIARTILLTGPQLTFTSDLLAPGFMDDTPTHFDHGSFGILAVVGVLEEYDVCTVTTKAFDLMVDETSLVVTYSGEGTKDDIYTAEITIYNPMNYGVGEFSFELLNGSGSQVYSQIVSGLQAKEIFQTSVELGKFPAGEHSLELMVDDLHQIYEYNESNNAVKVNYTVLERPKLFVSSSIAPGNISSMEGGWVNITATVTRGGEPIPTWNWTIDGQAVEWDNDINLSLGFIGELSSREEPYVNIYYPNPSYIFDDENGTMVWDLTVTNVNRAPELLRVSPLNDTMEISEPEVVSFTIDVSDPDLTTPIVEWSLDGIPVQSSSNDGLEFNFTSNFLGANSSEFSPYLIEVRVFDEEDPLINISRSWTVVVSDTDREPLVNVTPEPGPYEVLINRSVEFSATVEDPDGDEASASWKVRGNHVSDGLSFLFSPMDHGIQTEETVGLALVLVVGSFEMTYNWTIDVVLPPEPEDPEPVKPLGVTITSPLPGQEFQTTDTIHFKAEHIDARLLVFTWYINGTFYTGQEVNISGLAPGDHVAVLNVSTEGPPPGWDELSVEFKIKAPDGVVDDDDEVQDEPFPWWLIVIILLGAVVMALITYLLFTRSKKDVWSEE